MSVVKSAYVRNKSFMSNAFLLGSLVKLSLPSRCRINSTFTLYFTTRSDKPICALIRATLGDLGLFAELNALAHESVGC